MTKQRPIAVTPTHPSLEMLVNAEKHAILVEDTRCRHKMYLVKDCNITAEVCYGSYNKNLNTQTKGFVNIKLHTQDASLINELANLIDSYFKSQLNVVSDNIKVGSTIFIVSDLRRGAC